MFRTLLLFLCVVGCGTSAPDSSNTPKPEMASAKPVSELVIKGAETELHALRMSRKQSDAISRRIEFLETLKSGGSQSWTDSNSTRADCLALAEQLEALAIGRGFVSDGDSIEIRMKRLRSRLKQAGYFFDDAGYEEVWDETGKRREGYEPLLSE